MIIDVLKRFADQQASKDEAMRALVEHDGWFVPAWMVPGEHVKFDQLVMFSTQGPAPARLWLFSDERRAQKASESGYAMGLYGGPMPGHKVFTLLDERFDELDVNPGSPPAESWNIARGGYPLAKAWAKAVQIERAFYGDPHELAKLLAAYEDFMVLAAPDDTLVKLPFGADDFLYGLVFTTPEFRDACVAQLAPDQRARVRSVSMRGKDLFGALPKLGVRGVIVNITAPDHARTMIPLEVAELVAKV